MGQFIPLLGDASLGPFADRSAFDGVYCVTLEDRPVRRAAAEQHLRAMGLAGVTTLFVAKRGRHFPRSVWTSHRDMARHALARGMQRVLMLEDDAEFHVGPAVVRRRLARALTKLPQDWQGLFLGHLPLQMYPIGWGVARTRSAAAHAYLANASLLEWLARTEPMDPEVPVSAIGASIDAALANRPNMYALVPMIATQRTSGESRFDPQSDENGRRRSLMDLQRYRPWALSHGLRIAEVLGLAGSPWHWLTLERNRRASGQALVSAARALRESGTFDEAWYLKTYPDVTAGGRLPIEHYLRGGQREGRRARPDG